MVIDGLARAFMNIVSFSILVLIVKGISHIRERNYTPLYWIGHKNYDIKLLLWGGLMALLYQVSLGLICAAGNTMIFVLDQSGIVISIIYTLASSLGFFGVALFEEGLFRGYLMQVVLKKLPKFLAIILQAVVFGLVHYSNYSILPHRWISIIDAMLIGVIFGVIVIKTKSLMLVIGVHMIYDVCCEVLFLDNSYKFTRFISFHKTYNTGSILLGGLFYTEFIELIMLSIISLTLILLFRKDIFYKKTNEYFLDT